MFKISINQIALSAATALAFIGLANSALAQSDTVITAF